MPHRLFSSCSERGLLTGCGRWAQKLRCMGLVSPHVGSSQTRDRTCVSCIGRQILYLWPTRKPCWIIFEGKLIVSSREFEIRFETWGKGLGQTEDLGAFNIWDGASLVAQLVKNLPTVKETEVRFPGWEGPLEKEMATGSSILAWRIPWTEEPGGLQSMGCNSRTQFSD